MINKSTPAPRALKMKKMGRGGGHNDDSDDQAHTLKQRSNSNVITQQNLPQRQNEEESAKSVRDSSQRPEEAPQASAARVNEVPRPLARLSGMEDEEEDDDVDSTAARDDTDEDDSDVGDGPRDDNQDAAGQAQEGPTDWLRPVTAQARRRLMPTSEPYQPDLWLEQPLRPTAVGGQQLQSWLANSWGTRSPFAPPPLSQAFPPFSGGYTRRPVWSGPAEYYGQLEQPQRQAHKAVLASYLSAIYGIDPVRPELYSGSLLDQLDDDELWILGQRLALIRAEQQAAQHVPKKNQTKGGGGDGGNLAASATSSFGRLFGSGPSMRGEDGDFRSVTLWLPLAAILSALAFTVVLVKLIMRRLDKVMNSSRRLSNLSSFSYSTVGSKARFWAPFTRQRSSQRSPEELADEGCCGTIKGENVSAGTSGQDLGRAPPTGSLHKRGLSADSGLDTIDAGPAECGTGSSPSSSDKLRKSFDLLAERLARFMNSRSRDNDDGLETLSSATADQGDAEVVGAGAAKSAKERQQFRSSTSYIRSLIEALTKAASVQMASKSGERRAGSRAVDDDDDDEDDDGDDEGRDGEQTGDEADRNEGADEFIEKGGEPSRSVKRPRRRRRTKSGSDPQRHLFVEDQDEILMSQMDISAAHLILDYMEKHLVDKERLRREWLELSATTGPDGGPAAPSKANQLLLQRLARVALSEENFYKNRDPNVVPFDRNRVRLGTAKGCEQQLEPTAPTTSGKGSRRQQRQSSPIKTPGDYINASFIYDDDPRRPTHIIAQGPKEQTCGQFWQMVWEQEVSVIVMLTRLNENGNQMCHCYWPTSVAAGVATDHQSSGAKWSQTSGNGCAESTLPSSSSPPPPQAGPAGGGARRGSVTSVFSGSAAAAGKQTIPQPIVAGGEPNDNVLYFEPNAGAQEPRPGREGAPLKFEVHLISEHVSSGDYLVRNMYLINRTTGETRTVSQFHYLAWLEGRTPDNVRSFLQFRRKVHKSYRNSGSPILVHCSDGAGRSGTYTLIDMILERIKNGAKEIDLRATLEHLRDQRPGLCASQSQFEFALVALAEEIQIILNALPQ